jgi:AraC family transcriptional regulator of adaptative response/methylated-DNA-[protein]-cysteine methyltransferase
MTPTQEAIRAAAAKTVGDARWAKIIARDRSSDGQFVFGVRTTGVYCRPSCPARTAKPENVEIFDTSEAARAGGYRSCKRCYPDGQSRDVENAALIEKTCRLIEASETTPKLETLAAEVEMSPGYFHRVFKAATGLTPADYAKAMRARRVRSELVTSNSVTEAVYGAGYNSSGRFYETAGKVLGMTPKSFRAGGAGEELHFAVGESSLGPILVATSAKGIAAILMGDDPNKLVEDLQDSFPNATLVGADADFESLIAKVVGHIESPTGRFDLPLDVRGTAFQQRVWKALAGIPTGKTASYSEIARKLGEPQATRAVAGACAANKIAVAIPCHRVVRSDGGLSGYRWGVERKTKLLDREKSFTTA